MDLVRDYDIQDKKFNNYNSSIRDQKIELFKQKENLKQIIKTLTESVTKDPETLREMYLKKLKLNYLEAIEEARSIDMELNLLQNIPKKQHKQQPLNPEDTQWRLDPPAQKQILNNQGKVNYQKGPETIYLNQKRNQKQRFQTRLDSSNYECGGIS